MSELDWQRVAPLLDELFELEADARAVRLASIESTDAALAAELTRLLAADRTGGILDEGLEQASPTLAHRMAGEPAAAHVGRLEAGARLGPYRLLERIGAGGMGEVWRGERSDDFEQEVAIKLIRPLMDSPQLRERFARERRILARLDHPNIARLLDGGVSEDGTPWYAMEFVPGSDILAWARERKLGVRGRVELLLQVCEAVAQAQAQLVVHRDLKPSNILVDAAGRARVLDFGIARLLDDSGEVRLTGTGVRVYSPAYAAPEQIRGDSVGTAADVFSLGAVLYELLTGELAHPRRRATSDHLLAGLEHETAPRPSQSLREKERKEGDAPWFTLAREVHGDLDLIVATALHPDPARRYVGAAQLGDDLRRWLDGHPIAARADTAGYRMRMFASRHRFAVASFGAVLLALLVGLGLSLWQMELAREQARRADEEARRLDRTYRFVISVFDSIQPSRGGGNTPEQTVHNLLRSGLARIDNELPDLPDVRAGLRAQWSGLLISMGHSDEGLPLLERAVSEFESQSPELDSDLASALISLAAAYKDAGRLAPAETAARRALDLLDTLPGDQRDWRIKARTILANIATNQFRADEAITQHELILAERRERPGDAPIDLAVHYNNLAAAYLFADRHAEAETHYRELDQLLRESPEAPPSRRVFSLSGIAWSLLGQGRYDEALAVADEMQTLGRATLSDSHDLVVNGQTLRARAALAQGRVSEGDALFEEAIPRLAGNRRSIALLHWGAALLAQRRHDEARSLLARAADTLESAGLGNAPPGVLARALLAISHAHDDPANTVAAEQALDRFEKLGLQPSDEHIRAALAMADLLARQGQTDNAGELRAHAAAMAAALLGESHPLTLHARREPDKELPGENATGVGRYH